MIGNGEISSILMVVVIVSGMVIVWGVVIAVATVVGAGIFIMVWIGFVEAVDMVSRGRIVKISFLGVRVIVGWSVVRMMVVDRVVVVIVVRSGI